MKDEIYDVIIIGGGLAGLINAMLLTESGRSVLLIEKKQYPFHKVCGEYISNEVLGFLQEKVVDPVALGASSINKLRISSPSGKNNFMPLDLGGFGISRYLLDKTLAELAIEKGVTLINDSVTSISNDQYFEVTTASFIYKARLVIGSYGKRSQIDKSLNRSFMNDRTGYIGVKYHIKTDYPIDEIGLDCFDNGYCGIVKIEKDLYNLSYLYKRNQSIASIPELEKEVLFKNPKLKSIFENADFCNEKPLVINEINFHSKNIMEQGIYMCGDAAGMIPPLCGNGMSMAIQGARLLSSSIIKHTSPGLDVSPQQHSVISGTYTKEWNHHFRLRVRTGRMLQGLFGNTTLTTMALKIINGSPWLQRTIISNTHGQPF